MSTFIYINTVKFRVESEKQSPTHCQRTLDQDLGSVMRAGQAFEWDRIPFVLEATWPNKQNNACQKANLETYHSGGVPKLLE
jgi:hypothetical protein